MQDHLATVLGMPAWLLLLIAVAPPLLRWQWVMDRWDQALGLPLGAGWPLLVSVLAPVASFVISKPTAFFEQTPVWLATTVWVVFAVAVIYGIARRDKEQQNQLLAFSDRSADLFREEGERIVREGKRIIREGQQGAIRTAIAAEGFEIEALERSSREGDSETT